MPVSLSFSSLISIKVLKSEQHHWVILALVKTSLVIIKEATSNGYSSHFAFVYLDLHLERREEAISTKGVDKKGEHHYIR